MIQNLYTRLALLLAPRPLRERSLPAVRGWAVIGVLILWVLVAILMGQHH